MFAFVPILVGLLLVIFGLVALLWLSFRRSVAIPAPRSQASPERRSVLRLPVGRPPFITGALQGLAFEYPGLAGWGHRLDADYVAPLFSEVYETLLDFLNGGIVVAHNAPFDEWFLAAECARLGIALPRFHGLDSCWLSRQVFPKLSNHRLATVASSCRINSFDSHSAAGDVRALVNLLPKLLSRGPRLHWGISVPRLERTPKVGCRTRPRAPKVQSGEAGWMFNLMSAMPEIGNSDATSARYAELLAAAMSDGKIIAEEARELAHVAADEGLSARQVREIHAEFLEGMRSAALADRVITAAELKELGGAARTLGLPLFFDDLEVTPRVRSVGVGTSEGASEKTMPRQVRCGICGFLGHNRRSCTTSSSSPSKV
jgi:DNA polymerase III subunit epsilon